MKLATGQTVNLYLLYVRDGDGIFKLDEIFTNKVQAEAWSRAIGHPIPSRNAYIKERETVPHDDNC